MVTVVGLSILDAPQTLRYSIAASWLQQRSQMRARNVRVNVVPATGSAPGDHRLANHGDHTLTCSRPASYYHVLSRPNFCLHLQALRPSPLMSVTTIENIVDGTAFSPAQCTTWISIYASSLARSVPQSASTYDSYATTADLGFTGDQAGRTIIPLVENLTACPGSMKWTDMPSLVIYVISTMYILISPWSLWW